jgi:hypothetical protein
MDDFTISSLSESRNEWCARLVSIFTPLVIEGIRSIFNESWRLCTESDEMAKYLMTFQNLLSRVPKWNAIIVEDERKRIIDRSGCNYLEDLITCVHVIQLKVLTCIRVGNKQKQIDISIPKLDTFIHKVYINAARKVYSNVYLFEKNVSPLQQQKNNRELEVIVQECILTAIRESIPTEDIIRAYLAESVEHEEEVTIEHVPEPVAVHPEEAAPETPPEGMTPEEAAAKAKEEELAKFPKPATDDVKPESVPSIKDLNTEPVITRLTFNDVDSVLDLESNREAKVSAPKDVDRLEAISAERAAQRKLEEELEEMDEKLQIGESISLGDFDTLPGIGSGSSGSNDDNIDLVLDDIIELK